MVAHPVSARNSLEAGTKLRKVASNDIEQSRHVFDVTGRGFDLHPTTQTSEDRLRFGLL
jgi:hypothetical protein